MSLTKATIDGYTEQASNTNNRSGSIFSFGSQSVASSKMVLGRDTVYTNLGVGASAVFRNGKSVFVFYETHIQHDFVAQNWLKFGLKLEF